MQDNARKYIAMLSTNGIYKSQLAASVFGLSAAENYHERVRVRSLIMFANPGLSGLMIDSRGVKINDGVARIYVDYFALYRVDNLIAQGFG